ncbi:MAG: DUF3301 domain-containing protein [Pseudomonadales bacterium]|nr:DUF3301 domain-containing protein [Pseudomonadales bacterium]
MLFESVLLIAIGLSGLYLYSSLRAKELAIAAARKCCRQQGVQLLDQSVSMRKVKLGRHNDVEDGNSLYLCRDYGFEFTSTGDERYQGHVTLHGHRVAQIQLQAHRMPQQEQGDTTP